MQLKSMCAKLVVAMLVMSMLLNGFVGTPQMKADSMRRRHWAILLLGPEIN